MRVCSSAPLTSHTFAFAGMFDFTGKAKHAAWMSRLGLSKDDAKTQYIAFVAELEAAK